MAWLYLLLAGLFEILWASLLKHTEGFTKLGPSVVTLAAMAISFALLAAAMKSLPLGTAYAIWTGIGAVGVFSVGVLFLGEAASLHRIASVAVIVAGMVSLKLASS